MWDALSSGSEDSADVAHPASDAANAGFATRDGRAIDGHGNADVRAVRGLPALVPLDTFLWPLHAEIQRTM